MGKKCSAGVFLVVGLAIGINFIGCKKGGPEIPYDIPYPTPTPVTGAIEAGVIDNGSPVSGVTVLAVDPLGTTLTSVTDSFGLAAFNPAVLQVGTWTMMVPTQGRYYASSLPLVVSGGGSSSVTFQAGGQTISATPVSPQTYGSSNTDIAYHIIYDQPFNLRVPVVLSATGLPAGWLKNFLPVTIGTNVDDSAVTITKNGCYYQNYPFSFDAKDVTGGAVGSEPETILRGYVIPVGLQVSSGTSTFASKGSASKTVFNFDISLSTGDDCNYSYPVKIMLYTTNYPTGGPVTNYNQSFNYISGGVRSYAITVQAFYSQEGSGHIVATLTNSIGQMTGTKTTGATFSGVLINSSY